MTVNHLRVTPLVGFVWLAGCNPGPIANTTNGEDSGSDSSEATTSTPQDVPPDPPEDLPPADEYGTWEGLLELCEPDPFSPSLIYSHFLPCGSDERWGLEGEPILPVNGCTAVWVVARGTLTYDPLSCLYDPNAPPDHEKTLIVDELLDVRLCEPSDCGGTPLCEPEKFDCHATDEQCEPLVQDCPDGERCLPSQRYEYDIKPPGTTCLAISDMPLQVGDPCLVWYGVPSENVDQCDRGLMCAPFQDGDPQGICRAFCDPEGIDGPVCNGNCAPCDHGGLCFEDCPECEAEPYC